ncbi:ThuA domain-containing protein [Micromonospora sp. NPDC049523]|uniref:ThuA domain-containing protein n=1 Tax=Micromonospora sp. NPDC049523 TaxID=3155921 RepID=UPI0034156E8F
MRRSEVEHPITSGPGDFEVHDERYLDLDLVDHPDIEPLYVHEEGGALHPLLWARSLGRSRVVYDALGHDIASYESPGLVELIGRIASWLRHRDRARSVGAGLSATSTTPGQVWTCGSIFSEPW